MRWTLGDGGDKEDGGFRGYGVEIDGDGWCLIFGRYWELEMLLVGWEGEIVRNLMILIVMKKYFEIILINVDILK